MTTSTIESAEIIAGRDAQYTLAVQCDDVTLTRAYLSVPPGASVSGVQAAITYSDGNLQVFRMLPWNSVEQIAAYVAGDGTDAQRVALAAWDS